MKPHVILFGTFLTTALFGSQASAQYPPYPGYPGVVLPQAPDACGPGFNAYNIYGQPFGPNYCVTPPYPPFQGMIFQRMGGQDQGQRNMISGFRSHPYARSPRDFFMYE